ncbi:MAG TPA: Gfo/Idh/MocA family oxidoreductase [Chthonomonadaceae bacterium]|nr:Gfo/Idh/MocA family oxidoreductase [Chthonomonadaceae bacterium]
MIRIGVVNIDTSHPLAFSKYLEQGNRARYVAVYNDGFRGDDEVEAFIRNHGLEKRCQSVEELADYVDIGFVQGCDWDQHLRHALPFIERGKPVFIDKPLVGYLADCKALENLADKGAVILGSSSARYAQEIADFLVQPESERGKILNVYGTAGVDEFNYGIHIVEAIGGVMGTGAVSTQFVGSGEAEGKRAETFFVRFADGRTAVYTLCHGVWQPFEMVIMTTKSTFQFRMDTSKIYAALLDRICDFMETGQNRMAPVNALTESVKIMLAGRLSRERGGGEVRLADIPADDPGYDGADFARGYAAAASKLYLK